MAAAMLLMFVGDTKTLLYIGIALVGYGNSNIFSMAFSEALLSVPDKQNEVSGLMIMGLFGGTVFPLLMGFASDAVGQSVSLMTFPVSRFWNTRNFKNENQLTPIRYSISPQKLRKYNYIHKE